MGTGRRLSSPSYRDRSVHLVGLPCGSLPQELWHADRSPLGNAPVGGASRRGGDRSGGWEGQADPIGPCAPGDRHGRAGPVLRRGVGGGGGAHRCPPPVDNHNTLGGIASDPQTTIGRVPALFTQEGSQDRKATEPRNIQDSRSG